LLISLVASAGCAGRHKGARTLGGIGTAVALSGTVGWAVGESLDDRSSRDTFTRAGFTAVAVGIAAMIASGGWIALSVTCQNDPDCHETEVCREIPAPPGGIPYKQCMGR
jgi:hypothetical protein